MLRMVLLLAHLLSLSLLVSNGASQESVQVLTLYHGTAGETLPPGSFTDLPTGVTVSPNNLHQVSLSIVMAENWLRAHVLSHYPSTNINTIVVGHNLMCKQDEQNFKLVLLSLKNLHHSLVRWGLEKDIKVSPAFDHTCAQQILEFSTSSPKLKPILDFLQEINSTYSVSPSYLTPISDKTLSKSMKELWGLSTNNVNVILPILKEAKPTSRKLSSMDPFPPRPTPFSPLGPSPAQFVPSVPSNAAAVSPLPPLVGISSPPSFSQPPVNSPPHGVNLPPCIPPRRPTAPPPMGGGWGHGVGMWCVAKPTVPAETLQTSLDYACGEGGGDCLAITPGGSCYNPDTLVAHASYAFNSYWQKNKRNGGTCGFGGTAMLINSDPSFLQCHFILI